MSYCQGLGFARLYIPFPHREDRWKTKHTSIVSQWSLIDPSTVSMVFHWSLSDLFGRRNLHQTLNRVKAISPRSPRKTVFHWTRSNLSMVFQQSLWSFKVSQQSLNENTFCEFPTPKLVAAGLSAISIGLSATSIVCRVSSRRTLSSLCLEAVGLSMLPQRMLSDRYGLWEISVGFHENCRKLIFRSLNERSRISGAFPQKRPFQGFRRSSQILVFQQCLNDPRPVEWGPYITGGALLRIKLRQH